MPASPRVPHLAFPLVPSLQAATTGPLGTVSNNGAVAISLDDARLYSGDPLGQATARPAPVISGRQDAIQITSLTPPPEIVFESGPGLSVVAGQTLAVPIAVRESPHNETTRVRQLRGALRAGGAQRGVGRGQAGDGHAVGRAGDVVEADGGEEGHRGGVAAVLAADADFEIGSRTAALIDANLHELANAAGVDGSERIRLDDFGPLIRR